MQRWPRRTIVPSLIATAALVISGATQVRAQDETAASPAATPSGASRAALLPRDVILPLTVMQEIVPEMTSETATGANATAVGNPTGTRVVTFATADGDQRVVLSVDRYRSADDASTAFEEAFRKSQEVPGATAEAVSDLGEAALIGVVTQGDETHVGGGRSSATWSSRPLCRATRARIGTKPPSPSLSIAKPSTPSRRSSRPHRRQWGESNRL